MPDRRRGPRVHVREVRAHADRALGQAHRLLRLIFPRAELLPLSAWAESLREREAGLWTDLDWHVLVAQHRGRVVGAASGSYLGNVNMGLVGYVAVIRRLRGRGIGCRLRRSLRAAIARDAKRIHGRELKAMIGEVHHDNRWLRHVVRVIGALALDFPYFQPSLHHRARPVELVLYYEPLTGPRHSLPTDEVRRLVYTLWRRVYRIQRPLADAQFRRMLRALPRGRRVGARALAALETGG